MCDIGHSSPIVRLTTKSPKHAECVEPKNDLKRTRSVMFEGADIVEFEPTIFTTTVTSGGVPVGLSNKERRRIRRRLDSFELEREVVRVCRQNYMEEGYLDPEERVTILGNAGCEAASFETVEAEVNMIIAHRRDSNENDVQCMYGLGEYGQESDNEMDDDPSTDNQHHDVDDDDDENDDPGPSPFYGNCFAQPDSTHEWKQTLDIIACSDMADDLVFKPTPTDPRCTEDTDLFFLTSGESLSDFDLSSGDIEADLPVL
ncbi:Aste57867_8895 [Aphanomyces stellatus]|uniref:Aste57867_8895 protein n=1 Tax=Aphanomyces stellatus TaxID=120398 RepID=A0A485KLU6_9STRA|nr:hypothetical protein As57867_008860 [Aphanomyces stellatus]VFT85779.1 Aste57867_8895 [Aphanomyces stellatus]